MVYKYTNFRTVLNKLYRDLNLTSEINEGHVISWIAEVIDKIGAYSQYEQFTKKLELDNGRCELPCNFDKLVMLAYNDIPLSWSVNRQVHYISDNSNIPNCCTENHFYIANNILVTDITTMSTNDKLVLTYLGVAVDEEGYPLIPDLTSCLEACAKYITYMLDYREWRKGNIPDKVLDKSEKEYLWYIGQAKNELNMPIIAQMERLKNIWVRLLPLQNEYNNNFRNLGNQERRIRH